jgi:prophage maintenance system killer protein
MAVFLDLNGYELDAPEPGVVRTMPAVAAGEASKAELAARVRGLVHPLQSD